MGTWWCSTTPRRSSVATMVIVLDASDKVIDPCCYWCGHARVETVKRGRVLRATDTAKDAVCGVCHAWAKGEDKLSGNKV